MKQRLRLLLLLLPLVPTHALLAQKLSLETYRVKVITKTGERTRGILADVTPNGLYCTSDSYYGVAADDEAIPLETIRKVVLRRSSKRRAIQAGAIVGAITFGLLAIDGLKNNPTSNSVAYGATVVLAAGAGAAVGLVVGSAVGNVTHRVVRPRNRENSTDDFRRQLEPFSVRYQNDVFNRIQQ